MKGKIELKIPTTWNELSFQQIENICAALHYNQVLLAHKKDPELTNKATFLSVAKELLRHNTFKNIYYALKEVRVKAFVPYTDFIFKENQLHKFPETLNGFIGPHFRLKNISIGELSFADALYFKWKQTQTEAYLDRLCASLYRPESPAPTPEDKRVPFSKILAEANSDAMATLPLYKKLVVAYAFEGCRNYMVSQFPTVFPKPRTQDPTPNTQRPQPKTPYVPFGKLIAFKINYDPSKLELTEQMNAYKFLSLYETELRELKKQPRK